MHRGHSLQGSGLVRTVVQCTKARVAIDIKVCARGVYSALHSRATFQAGGLFFVIPNDIESGLVQFGWYQH